jgi:3-(3-hydroxy-phenyl)propionate hydroxylase
MRPAGRGELDSLYFTYPHFAAPPPGAARESAAPVAIVGAGPVGMTAALALAAEGVPSLLIERKGTFNDGSRAICISRSSYHILDRLGVVAPFLEHALGWTSGRTFYRGRQILEFHMPDGPDERFRPMYNLQQQYIEAFLWDAIAGNPLIEARWQTELAGIADTADGVTLQLRDPHGEYRLEVPWLLAADGVALQLRDPHGDYRLEVPWLLAADGARSAARRMRGLRLKGENYEGRYVIADVRMRHDYPTIRRALFDPACRPGGTVLIHRQPQDIWRIDYQLRPAESAEEATREETVRAAVGAVLDEIGHRGAWELEWWSVYSANTLALDDYRDRRVFFIGDAAHIVPIFGVRGLNNGLADAHNIGWKLGRVLTGRAEEGLLDSYSPERRGATLDVFANAAKSTRFMTPPSRGWALMRDAALSLALDHPWAGALANPRQMTPYTYADSPAVAADPGGFGAGAGIGAMLPDAALDGGFLSERLGRGFTLLCFGPPVRAEHADLTVLPLAPDGAAAHRLGAPAGAAVLVRPDLHIAARWPRMPDATTVLRMLAAICAGKAR